MIRAAAYRRTMIVLALVLVATISTPLAEADDYSSLSLPGVLSVEVGIPVSMLDDDSDSHGLCSCNLCMEALWEELSLPSPPRCTDEQPNSMPLNITPSNFCSEIFHPPSA